MGQSALEDGDAPERENAAPAAPPPVDSEADVILPLPVSDELADLIGQRLGLLMQIEQLEAIRDRMRSEHGESIPDAVARELNRQSRELQRLPNGEVAAGVRERLEKKLNQDADAGDFEEPEEEDEHDPLLEDSDLDEDASADNHRPDLDEDEDGDSEDDDLDALDAELDADLEEDDEEEAEPAARPAEAAPPNNQGAPPLEPLLIEAFRLGCRQATLFERRDALTAQAVNAGARLAEHEPLRFLLDENEIDCNQLYGWTSYMLALEQYRDTTAAKLESLESELQNLQADKALRKKHARRIEKLEEQGEMLKSLTSAIRRESKACEMLLVDAFWIVYEQAAVLMTNPVMPDESRLHLRSLLRYGILMQQPHILPRGLTHSLMHDCAQSVEEWDSSTGATHLLYADEYIDMASRGHITPSLDEDLELNGKGTEIWRTDKLVRKAIHAQVQRAALGEVLTRLKVRIDEITSANDDLQRSMDKLNKTDAKYKEKRARRLDKIKANRVESARLERAAEVITGQRLPAIEAADQDNQSKLHGVVEKLTPERIARREAKAMRRMARLCAKLKEPFLPFVIRDFFKPDAGVVNDRETMTRELEDFENADANIFREVLVHAKKQENRIYLRYCPYIVMIPCRGMMSLSWNPRGGTEVGRIAIPFMNMRPGGLTDMLQTVMADFRYDTSKESAGVDLLTSDTLVAAYATVRWNYRKRGKDVREKAGIFNEEKDRVNWRRHYKLFVSSAQEGGKRLFFKCPEVYEAVVKYVGLPDGIEKLRAA